VVRVVDGIAGEAVFYRRKPVGARLGVQVLPSSRNASG
jgi:hypothetical protein